VVYIYLGHELAVCSRVKCKTFHYFKTYKPIKIQCSIIKLMLDFLVLCTIAWI